MERQERHHRDRVPGEHGGAEEKERDEAREGRSRDGARSPSDEERREDARDRQDLPYGQLALDGSMKKVIEGAVELPMARVDAEARRERPTRLEKRCGEDRRGHRGDDEQEPLPLAYQPGNEERGDVFGHHREAERDPRARVAVRVVERERDHEKHGRGQIHVAAPEALHQEQGIPVVK